MRIRLLLIVTVFLVSASQASAHLVVKSPAKAKLQIRETSQKTNLAHVRYVAKHGRGPHVRWHRLASVWLAKELAETRRLLHPPLAWRQTVAAWLPTFHCENGGYGWTANTGNGYYGGLQFDFGTWKIHGGQIFAYTANLATPAQQALVASRLTYDGWPNCPNP
jgi:hypothetical protein